MERTGGSRDLRKLLDWERRKHEQAGSEHSDLLTPIAAGSSAREDEAPASLEQHIRRRNNQRHETLYGTIKATDQDRPECDPETSYMDMQLSRREQNFTHLSMNEASGCTDNADRAELPWLSSGNGSSGSQCLYFSVSKERDCSNIHAPIRAITNERELLSVVDRSATDDSNSRLEWEPHLLTLSDYNTPRSKSFSPPQRIRSLLLEHWKTPKVFFDAHDHLWSGALTYNPGSPWQGYIFRNDRGWGWACTLAISYNPSSNTTYGVCIGLEERETQDLMFYLQREGRHAVNPLFIPIAITQFYLRSTIVMNRVHNDDFFNIQYSMKTNHYLRPPQVTPGLDLVEFTRMLTAPSTSSVGVTQLCTTQDRIIQFLFEQLHLLKSISPVPDDVLASLRDRLAFTREVLRAERQHNEYIKGASQAQVQMVYSLTAQNNESNLKLARLSQKQNNINIQISKLAAYESRLSTRVAKESLKSSADMQVIAAVTLGFLPGTFIATLFSTSFWNFGPANKDSVVSKWFWLYAVVTVVLTLAVLVAWRVVSRLKRESIGKLEMDLRKVLAIDTLGEFDEENPDEEKTIGAFPTPDISRNAESKRRTSHRR